MKTATLYDKSGWKDGPWKDEPDRIEWTDEETGYPCIIKRAPTTGALCGYVGVPEGHPAHGESYYRTDGAVEVHGGLTYGSGCDGKPDTGVCHHGDGNDPWWLGFDCAHVGDLMPHLDVRPEDAFFLDGSTEHGTYRDVEYVKNEVTRLARQLHALAERTY